MRPEEVEAREFMISLRGYDRDEVDAFLRELAQEFRELREAVRRGASDVPVEGVAPKSIYEQVGEETSKILVAAQEAAETIKAKARTEAAQAVADAHTEAEEIRRATKAERDAAEAEIAALQQTRATLATQLEDVGRRLNEAVTRLRMPVEGARAARSTPAQAEAPEAAAETPGAPEPRSFVPPEERAGGVEAEAAPAEAELEAVGAEPEAAETETSAEALEGMLEEIRREREEGRREVQEALAAEPPLPTAAPAEAAATSAAEEAPALEVAPPETTQALARRTDALGDIPRDTSSRLKKALQEDQNDLLDRIRTTRAKGDFDADISPPDEQLSRFLENTEPLLTEAFNAGRSAVGAGDKKEADELVRTLVSRQLVNPLRIEISKVVRAGMEAQDTPTAIADRASDVFRVWKGVRTEMLGEGLAYAVFHNGLLDQWLEDGTLSKKWIFDPQEVQCPNQACSQNAEAGFIDVNSAFPSGHMAPPAHGGCSCTVTASDG